MKEEIIMDYEWDLEFFLQEAAKMQEHATASRSVIDTACFTASRTVYQIAAVRMLYRLNILDSEKYPLEIYGVREKYVDTRINQIIKEETDVQNRPNDKT